MDETTPSRKKSPERSAVRPWRVEGIGAKKSGRGVDDTPAVPPWRRFLTLFIVLVLVNQLFYQVLRPAPKRVAVPYTTFLQQVDQRNVKEVTSVGDRLEGVFIKPITIEKKTSN